MLRPKAARSAATAEDTHAAAVLLDHADTTAVRLGADGNALTTRPRAGS
jgi:hypothetical protein